MVILVIVRILRKRERVYSKTHSDKGYVHKAKFDHLSIHSLIDYLELDFRTQVGDGWAR